jgi:hypothetical protein
VFLQNKKTIFDALYIKLLIMNHLANKFKVVLISIFAIFSMVACGPAKNDSGQNQNLPVLPQNQVQENTIETQAPVAATPEPANIPSSEENNSQVMINPPHGEPGHRCDIPVGAALNSPPASAPRQTITNSPAVTAPNIANNPTAPTIENAKKLNSSQSGSAASTQNSGRLNPPHGQPGHRCEIPVGSPLP